MSLPPELSPDLTRPLVDPSAPAPAAPAPAAGVTRGPRPLVRRGLGRALRSRPGRAAVLTSRSAMRKLLADDLSRGEETLAEVAALRARVAALSEDRLDAALLAARVGSSPAVLELSAQVDSSTINLELLKAEIRAIERTLHELGMAFAPATGLAGVGERFGELREQVNAVARRLRQMEAGRAAEGGTAVSTAVPAAAGDPGPLDVLFDYVAFERRFRGTPEQVLGAQAERYADLLAEHAPVLDIGCGRGELVELLAGRGVDVVGVEPDGGMASEALARGIVVHETDGASYLGSLAPGSIGAVFSAHVAEHVPFEALLELVHLSFAALAPGGVFVAETPNPASLVVLGNSFILDPTHQRPLHPSLFAFVCETAGFRDVRLQFYAPAEGYHLQMPASTDDALGAVVAQHAAKVNEVLFGSQEYAVIATKAG